MDIVSDVLSLLKLNSSIYFRTEFHAPWGICVPAYENVARFHFVHRGRCWISVKDIDEKFPLNQGDLVIIPHGVEHSIFDPADAEIESLEEATSHYLGEGVFVYGDTKSGADTQLICGHWSFEKDTSHPLIEMLPKHIRIERSNAPSSWLENTLTMIGSETEMNRPGHEQVTLKLSESILIYVIRDYLISGDIDAEFYNALKDEKILKVLQEMHRTPSYSWTLEAMSSIALLSRTSFMNRFTSLVGMTPLQYLTHWRMQIGRQILSETDSAIIEIAERVGYQSEAAFGRVFKKHFNMGPAEYRRNSRLVSAA